MTLIKLKVKLGFNNDDTGYRYEAGDEFEVTEERYAKMQERAEAQKIKLSDYVEVIKAPKSKPAGDSPAK